MDGIDVRPQKWADDLILLLFDDGVYSVIWGRYEGTPALGVRWNDAENPPIGYPSLFGHPMWYVKYNPIAIFIVQGLQGMAAGNIGRPEHYNLDNIAIALREIQESIVQGAQATPS